jgi:hypothetical protein
MVIISIGDDLVLSVRQETAYVFGPRQVNRDPGLGVPLMQPLCLWPLTNKQGSGVGHTLNASLALGWPL